MNKEKFAELLKSCQDCEDIETVNKAVQEIAYTVNPYYICDFAENVKLADTKENMKKLEDSIIQSGDLVHMYEFMFLMVDSGIENFDLNKFETIIRNSKNPKLMCYCIGFVPGIDSDKMLEALYESKNAKYIERLSDEEYGLEFDSFPGYHQKLAEAKDYNYFPDCLNQFGIHDINQLIEKVLETKNPYLINELSDYIEYLTDYKGEIGLDIKPLQEAQLKYADPLHLYEFAASVMTSDKLAFQKSVIESNMPKYMYYVYEYVAGVNKNELKEAIEKSGNTKYIDKIKLSELAEKDEELSKLEAEERTIGETEDLLYNSGKTNDKE